MSTTSVMRQPRRCQFIKANGEQCKNTTRNTTGFCQAHPDGRGSFSQDGSALSRMEAHSSRTMTLVSGSTLSGYAPEDEKPYLIQSELVTEADKSTVALIDDLNRKPRNKIRLKTGEWFDNHRARLLSEAMDSHADLTLAKRGFDTKIKEVGGWIEQVSPREDGLPRGYDGYAQSTRFDGRSAMGDLTEEQIAEASRVRIDPSLTKQKFPNLYSQCCTGKDESIALYHKGLGAAVVQDWKQSHCPNGDVGNRFENGQGSRDDLEYLHEYRSELEGYRDSVMAAQDRLKKAIRDTIPQDQYLVPSNREPSKSVRINAGFKPGKFSPDLAKEKLSRRSLAQVTIVDLDPNVVRKIAPDVWERHQQRDS